MKKNQCEIFIKSRLNRNESPKVVRLFYVTTDSIKEIGQNLLNKSKNWVSCKYGDKTCWEIDLVANNLLKDIREDYRLTTFNHLTANCACVIDCTFRQIRCFKAEYDFNLIDDNMQIQFLEEISL